jgi:hypothetical protein
VIRPGAPEDAEGVARVHVETWQAAYLHVLPSERLQSTRSIGGPASGASSSRQAKRSCGGYHIFGFDISEVRYAKHL